MAGAILRTICIYVYMYICIYVYMYICIYVHMYICIYVYMYICIYVYIYICIYVYMYICIYVCISTYMYIMHIIYILRSSGSAQGFGSVLFRGCLVLGLIRWGLWFGVYRLQGVSLSLTLGI